MTISGLTMSALVAAASFQGAQPERLGFPARETDPWTLQYAAAHGNIGLLEMLLKLGWDVNQKGSRGNRALDIACLKGNAEIAKALIDHGADVKLRNSGGTTPLHDAALGGNPAVGELLLAHGAEMEAVDPESGATPIYNAAAFGKAEFVKMLIAKGAKTDSRLKSGKTALDAARDNGFTEIVKLLQRTR